MYLAFHGQSQLRRGRPPNPCSSFKSAKSTQLYIPTRRCIYDTRSTEVSESEIPLSCSSESWLETTMLKKTSLDERIWISTSWTEAAAPKLMSNSLRGGFNPFIRNLLLSTTKSQNDLRFRLTEENSSNAIQTETKLNSRTTSRQKKKSQ